MAISKYRIDQFMLAAQVMIENVLPDAEIKRELISYGYHTGKAYGWEKAIGCPYEGPRDLVLGRRTIVNLFFCNRTTY